MPGHFNTTLEDASIFNLELCPVTLHVLADDNQAVPLHDLYQQVISCVDPHLRLFRVSERRSENRKKFIESPHNNGDCSEIPAIALTIFCRGKDQDEDQNDGSNRRLENVQNLFQNFPWRFHHSEKLNQTNINHLHIDSHYFYYTSHDLPLWAVRQVHYGQEHIRYVLHVSDISWQDQVQLYKRIFGLEPDLLRNDFCLFTLCTQEKYDVQFALKKLDSNLRILTLQNVHINVKVKNAGHLVPLFPNGCRPISSGVWQTTDHDGNIIVLDSSLLNFVTSSQINTFHKSGLNIDQYSISTHRSQIHRETLPHLTSIDNVAKQPFQVHELSLNLINNHGCSLNPHLDNSVLSDCEDFGIDLPSPPLRYSSLPSKQEDDVESLTLTNTSEESGIQMQHGSDDLSVCEEDGLRSCLSKNSSLKVRHVKFKVRFKEEVETYECTFNQHSPEVSGEEHGDSEMETRFPHVPTVLENSSTYCEESSVKPTHFICVDDKRTRHTDSPHESSRHVSSQATQNKDITRTIITNKDQLNCDVDFLNYHQAGYNRVEGAPSPNVDETNGRRQQSNLSSNVMANAIHFSSSRVTVSSSTHCPSSGVTVSSSTHCPSSGITVSSSTHCHPSRLSDSTLCPPSRLPDSTHCPPSRLSDITHCPSSRLSDSTHCPPSRLSDITLCPSSRLSYSTHCPSSRTLVGNSKIHSAKLDPNICADHQHLRPDYENITYSNCVHHKTQPCTNKQTTMSLNRNRNSSFDQENKHTMASRPLFDTLAKDSASKQHKNRTELSTDVLHKDLIAPKPSTTDNKTKISVNESNSVERRLRENREKSGHSSEMWHVENGKKKFWFANTNLDLAQNGCSDQKETTLKFTLKFDTCSGLSCGQEQIGFFV